MKSLSIEQVNELYLFTEEHYVEWYDLQSELVDHLANDIELIMTNDSSLSFHTAKTKAFSKFGIFGFAEIIEKKQNSINNSYIFEIFNEFKPFFKLPKILFITFIGWSLWLVLNYTYYLKETIIFIGLSIFITTIYQMFSLNKSIKKRIEVSHKKWLSDNILQNFGLFGYIVWYPFTMLIYKEIEYSSIMIIGISLYLTFLGLFSYISLSVVPLKLNKKMNAQYPEFLLA